MIDIIPAILSPTRDDFHRRFKAVEPYTEWIQIDIVDGKFAPTKTIDHEVINRFRTAKKLEIQLMVEFIEDWIDPFVKSKPARIIVPVESARNPINLIRHVRRHQIQIGFSLNPLTDVSRMQHIIDKVDSVLLLAVMPGFQGQKFNEKIYKKIQDLREMRPDIYIEVDGGVRPGIARTCVEYGANALCVGSYILKNNEIEGETYQEKIKKAIEVLKEDIEGVSSSR
ncbi:ribulose-phosphate 3-epimerase [Patescibacteria group bacterium]|nr:ribulose-phosphate 3-epimerase [Patescibacteria group bacterium]